MIVTWRNKFVNGDESDKHYFSVYKGHPSEENFIRFIMTHTPSLVKTCLICIVCQKV